MNRLWVAIAMVGACVTGAHAAPSGDRWIHVRVDSAEGDRGHVDIQVPIGMVSGLVPLLKNKAASGELRLHGHDTDLEELRGYWAAVRDSKDGEYVTIRDDDADVRIAKSGGVLIVNVDEKSERGRVRVKLPLALVDAALGRGEDIDVGALVKALESSPSGDIVTVDDADSQVHIWIDDAPSSARDDRP
jgi:hypothetical protein